MNNNLKNKYRIAVSIIMSAIVFILSADDYQENGGNIIYFFSTLIKFSSPLWLYWLAFYLWGDGLATKIIQPLYQKSKNLTNNLKKNLPSLKKLTYVLFLTISMLIAGSISKGFVRDFLESRKLRSELKKIGATEDEAKEIIGASSKIINKKDGFDSFYQVKAFRALMLRKSALAINKDTPTKIDEITYLIKASTDEDKTLKYTIKVDMPYDSGKKIFNNVKTSLIQDRKIYWCYDKRAEDIRKMKAKILYDYLSKDMILIGSYEIDIDRDCL